MHAPVQKLPAMALPPRSRSRRERRSDAARARVLHVVAPGMEVANAEIKPRETIAAFLQRTGWATKDKKYGWQFKRGLPTTLEVNGQFILRKDWRKTRVAANDNARFVSYPLGGQGGGTKQVIGLVALIAVAAFATFITGGGAAALLGSAFASGTFGAYALGAAAGVGGALLVNALVAPKAGATNSPNATQDQIYTVGAQGNTAKLGQPLPVWYGRLKAFPDFAATPWGEFVGNDQYLNVLLSVGMGQFDYENVYIDETIFWDHSTGIDSSFTAAAIRFYAPGETVDLFPVNVDSSIEVSGQQLPDGSGSSNPVNGTPGTPGAPLGPFVTNPPGTQAQSIAVDYVLPAGCYILDVNDQQQVAHPTPIRLIAEYAPVNDAGALIGSFSALFDVTKSYSSKSPIRDSIKVDVTPGRYTVRLKRGDETLQSPQGTSVAIWAGLRAFIKGNSSFPDVSTIAIRLKASQSTQGSYKFGVLATRKILVWNGTSFVLQATRNNGWAFLDAATNSQYGSGLALSKIDFNAVVAFAAGCTARGDTFDYKFDSAVAVPESFDKILTAARARHFWLGDTVSVVRDEWRDVPSMMLTDREIVRDSTQVAWTMLGDEDPDAVVIEYVDEETWRPAEVQYPPNDGGFTAAHAEVKRIDGIINRDQAFRECAFFYLQSIYRRENVQIGVEYEGRAITYGSVLRIQSELPMAYGYGGAVVGISGRTLTLDPPPVWDTGPFYIRLRKPNGIYFGPVLATQGATAAIANLDATSLTTVQTAQGATLSAVLARDDGAEYPSFDLGTGVSESKLCLVLNGVPNGDHFTLNMVVDDQRVHATDLGSPPVLPTGQFPANDKVPLIVGLNATFGQGVAEPKLSASWFPAAGAFYYIADVSYDEGVSWQQVYEGQDNSFDRVVTLAALRLRVQAVGVVRGPYSTVDVGAPTIEIASNTVALNSLIEGLQFQVTTAFDRLADTQSRIEQLAAAVGTIDLARNWLDKKILRTELSSVTGAVTAKFTDQITVATDATHAVADRVTDLETEINDPVTGLAITSTNAENAFSAVSSDETGNLALAGRIDTIQNEIVDPSTGLSATASAVETLQSQVALDPAHPSAMSIKINALDVTVNDPAHGVIATSNATSTLIAQVNLDPAHPSAISGRLDSFSTTIDGHTTSISNLTGSIDGNSVQWGIAAHIDAATGGIAFSGVRTPTGTFFNFVVDGNVIVNGSISAGKLNVGQLAAITADLGTVIAGRMVSPDGLMDIDLNNRRIIFSDNT